MIKLTRLNGKEFFINPHQIETIEETPDTNIRLFSEKSIIVKEKGEEVLERIIEYRKKIGVIGNETTL